MLWLSCLTSLMTDFQMEDSSTWHHLKRRCISKTRSHSNNVSMNSSMSTQTIHTMTHGSTRIPVFNDMHKIFIQISTSFGLVQDLVIINEKNNSRCGYKAMQMYPHCTNTTRIPLHELIIRPCTASWQRWNEDIGQHAGNYFPNISFLRPESLSLPSEMVRIPNVGVRQCKIIDIWPMPHDPIAILDDR